MPETGFLRKKSVHCDANPITLLNKFVLRIGSLLVAFEINNDIFVLCIEYYNIIFDVKYLHV